MIKILRKNTFGKSGKKGQVYILAVIILIIFALISSYILISFNSSEKSKDEYIGVYQSGMIDAIIEGDKTLIYLQQVADYSTSDALKEFADNGGATIYDNGGEEKYSECKTYVYNLWNSESKECYPDYYESLIQYMYKSMIPKLQSNPDNNLQKELPFEFKYGTSSVNGSKLTAVSDIQYEYFVFKSKEYKEDPDIQNYINNKITYSDGSSFTVGIGQCKDITAFADKYIGASWSKNTVALPPEEAKTKGLQCGAFVTSVFKFGSNMAAPLGNGNQKCYNFQTNTVSPTVELIYKRNTDFKCITNVNCMSGLAALTEKELDNMKLLPGDIFSATTPTSYGASYGHTGIYVGKGRLETLKPGSSWIYLKFIPDNNGKHVAIHSGIGYSYISDLEANNRKMIAFCRHKGCITDKNLVNQVNCQVKNNNDWKITNIQVSQKEVSGDKTIKIITTYENPNTECASIASRPMFSATGQTAYVFDGKKMTDVYKDNKGKSYLNIETECTFTTDKTKLAVERGPDKCVLLAPNDNTKIKYTVTAAAKDAKGREERGKTVTFEVTKPLGIQGQSSGQPIVYPVDDFMKRNYEAVKRNMEKYKVIESVIKFSQQNNVPPELILGKMTQESSGIPGQKTGEQGLGGGLGQTTFSEFQNSKWAKPVRDKGCKVENFLKTDPFSVDCQVEAAILHLLDKKKTTDNDKAYEAAVKNTCKNPTYQQLYLSYPPKSWERALRAYNGFGCAPKVIGKSTIEPWLYISKVMGYAGLWGYSGTVTQISVYQQVAVDEIEGKGIIGKYYVNPSFTVNIPFDLSLIDNLSKFMNETVNECRISPLGKEPCLDSKITEFNKVTGTKYKSNGVNIELTRDCDESDDEKAFNNFIESVEDCILSTDFDCQCDLKKSGKIQISVDSDDKSALFSFTKSGITHNVRSYNIFLDGNNNPLKINNAPMNSINLYKKLGYLKSGMTNYKACAVSKSRFRLCLKTDYSTQEYDGQSLKEKNITLKFAVTIKDNDAPPPLIDVRLSNMKHSKNSIIVSWDESKKNGQRVPDVGAYNIYFSDIATDFNNDMKTIKNNVKHRTLDILNTGYEKIQDFDINQEPECEIIDDKYCRFLYSAKDSSGTDIKFELSVDKLYYIIDEERFFYIMNGSDQYNSLNNGRDKYIAVTAIDTDSNEINNINATEKITLGKNLQSIKPVDNLEPGLIKSSITVNTLTNMIQVTYNEPSFYINGEVMDNVPILYKAYVDWDCPSQKNPYLCDVKIPFNHVSQSGGLTMNIPKTSSIYRIGIIPLIRKNNIDAQYNSGFAEIIPVTP